MITSVDGLELFRPRATVIIRLIA